MCGLCGTHLLYGVYGMYERMNSYLFVLVYVPVCVYAHVNGYVHLQEIKMRMHARLQTCMCMCM